MAGKRTIVESGGPFLERPVHLPGPKSNSWNYDPHVSDIRKGKITSKFQSLKCVLIEATKGFMSPEKFRVFRETAPRLQSWLGIIGILVIEYRELA